MRNALLLLVTALATVALIWPVHAIAARMEPMLLGLPFSLAWLVIWLAIQCAALAAHFLTEDRRD